MSQPLSTETQIALLADRLGSVQREMNENKREAEGHLKRVKDEADMEIMRVRVKADSDNQNALAQIAALEDERNKALKWGVMTLGSAVLGMAYWIIDKIAGGHIR